MQILTFFKAVICDYIFCPHGKHLFTCVIIVLTL